MPLHHLKRILCAFVLIATSLFIQASTASAQSQNTIKKATRESVGAGVGEKNRTRGKNKVDKRLVLNKDYNPKNVKKGSTDLPRKNPLVDMNIGKKINASDKNEDIKGKYKGTANQKEYDRHIKDIPSQDGYKGKIRQKEYDRHIKDNPRQGMVYKKKRPGRKETEEYISKKNNEFKGTKLPDPDLIQQGNAMQYQRYRGDYPGLNKAQKLRFDKKHSEDINSFKKMHIRAYNQNKQERTDKKKALIETKWEGNLHLMSPFQKQHFLRNRARDFASYKGDLRLKRPTKDMHPSAQYMGSKTKSSYQKTAKHRERSMKKSKRNKGSIENPNYIYDKTKKPKHNLKESSIWH